MLNARETDKQQVDVILHDNVRNMEKAVDDMKVPRCTRESAVTVQRHSLNC